MLFSTKPLSIKPQLMSYNEYQEVSSRTDSGGHGFLYYVLGLIGEIGEFVIASEEFQLGEAGDCLWYFSRLTASLGLKASESLSETLDPDRVFISAEVGALGYAPSQLRNMEYQLLCYTTAFADSAKKVAGHGHAKDRMLENLAQLYKVFAGLCYMRQVALIDAAQHNIIKLRSRYPDGFSAEASKNRTS